MTWPDGVPPKPELRAALLHAHPWLGDDRFGPRNVTAGDCDRCGAEPRLVQTCGPGGGEHGRRCAREEDWCEGHAGEAAGALAWLAALPGDADDVAYLWWLSTGELRLPPGAGTSGGATPAWCRRALEAARGYSGTPSASDGVGSSGPPDRLR